MLTAEFKAPSKVPNGSPPSRHASIPDTELGSPLPSLDPDESNQRNGAQFDIAFRHSWWAADRRRIFSALQTVFPGSTRLARFRECGDAAWVYRSVADPARLKVCSDTCRDRWCRACQRDRSRIIASNLRTRLADLTVKLITLTLRHRDQPLRHQVDRLIDSFRTLRGKPIWKAAIDGGVAFIEVTYNPETNRWHPHLHVVCTGSFISQSDLSSTWSQITGGSYIVDVRAVRDIDQVAAYVVKYATKPMNTALYRHPLKLAEAVRALQARHLCMTFGTFRGWRLTQRDTDEIWIQIGSLEGFQIRAFAGDRDAQAVLDSIRPRVSHDSPPRRPP